MSLIDPVKDPEVNEDGTIKEPQDTVAKDQSKDIPDKLKGKSPEEVYEMYLNAEKDRSRMANELGQNRELVDRILKLEESRQAQTASQEEEFNLDPTELIANPVQTLDKYFERREKTLREQYDSRIQQLESQLGAQTIQSKHQDIAQITNDPAFLEFVQASPFRMKAAQQAVQGGDIDALDYLVTDFKERRGTTSQPQASEQRQDPGEKHERARKASLEGSSSGDAQASGKIYSRAEIMKKRLHDPDGYADPAYQAEIVKAYSEGRVR